MAGLITVVETPAYLAKAERLMSEMDRGLIVDLIAANPEAGVLIRGTGGVRKLRIPLAGRGKRGGGRVIYWFHSAGYPAVLLWAFAKNEADDLSADRRRNIAAVVRLLIDDFGGGK